MKHFISHYTAASLWKIPYVEEVLGSEMDGTNPDHITMLAGRKRYQLVNQIVHSCRLALPHGALASKDGKVVASPEFVFLQLAPKLDIHRLILLGLQLCSCPVGNPSAAITTKHKLATFLAKASGHRGRRKSLRAVRFVRDGSASVMESMVYMLLTLPHSLGGFGLSGAVFNYGINLGKKGIGHLGQKRCYVDLFYEAKNLAVEYESFTFHSSPSAQGKDMIRSVMLQKQGIEIMHLSTIQLYKRNIFTDFAQHLASHLGKRIQIRTNKFEGMHEQLRALLPSEQYEGKPVKKHDQ